MSSRAFNHIVLAAALIAPTTTFAASVTAPAKNWVLPLFTKEGHRSMTARGSEARATNQRQFEVSDLNLTIFTGDVSMKVDTVILAPGASFVPDEQRAFGSEFVRFIRDDVEATGQRWTYLHREKKISLTGNVRITFQAELTDLLR